MKTILFEHKRVFPSKVVCVARNYLEHIKELGNALPEQAVIFIKPNSAVTDVLTLPEQDAVGYEGEICFLIRDHAFCGVGFGLDLTKREIQTELKAKGLPWERAKAFNGSTVLSSFVPFSGDTGKLSLCLMVNGQVVQRGSVKEMIRSPEMLLATARDFLTMEDNDVLMTGTPEGVGSVAIGDEFHGQVFDDQTLLVEAKWRVLSWGFALILTSLVSRLSHPHNRLACH